MSWKTLILLFAAFGLSACVHTEVTEQTFSTSDGPYRKIMVCSLANNPDAVNELEAQMEKHLRKHHVDAISCQKVFGSTTTLSADTFASGLAAQGIQAVLVFQPQELSAEPDAPSPSMNQTEFSTLERFWSLHQEQASHMGTAPTKPVGLYQIQPYGKTRLNSGTIKLLSVKDDRIAWATGGTVEGSADTPRKDFIKSVVERTEDEMTDSGVIPEK